MAKAELKTKQTTASVDVFLDSLADHQQRHDSQAIIKMIRKVTGDEPKMWGPSIIGFGSTTIRYASGRELDWMKIGFSPKKGKIVLYGLAAQANSAKGLGKFRTGKGCLYIKRLSDIDAKVLANLIKECLDRKNTDVSGC